MGQLERDAKKLGMQLADDPQYGRWTGIFWAAVLILSVIGALVSLLAKVPGRAWIALGCGVIVLALVIWAVIAVNRRDN